MINFFLISGIFKNLRNTIAWTNETIDLSCDIDNKKTSEDNTFVLFDRHFNTRSFNTTKKG